MARILFVLTLLSTILALQGGTNSLTAQRGTSSSFAGNGGDLH